MTRRVSDPAAATRSGRRVLAVVRMGSPFGPSVVDRARSVARAHRATLTVLCIVARPTRGRAGSAHARRIARRERLARAVERFERWQGEGEGTSRAMGLRIEEGDELEVVDRVARKLQPSIVVVAAAGVPSRWLSLVRDHGFPVLVTRVRRGGAEILAATDLLDVRHPTLLHALRLASSAGHHVTLLHVLGSEAGAARPALQRSLDELCLAFPVAADGVLVDATDPADAVVETARARDTDLIVVGVHASVAVSREAHQTAARIVRRSGSSVLLVPLPPRWWVDRSSSSSRPVPSAVAHLRRSSR